jgi:hypothetical protein
MLTEEERDRFWSKVDVVGGCWFWMASRHKFGYGWFGYHGRIRTAHTVAYEDIFGHIPIGQFVLHHCDNPPCVRPDHLFIGTQQENLADMRSKNRHAHGISNGHAKLCDEDIIAIHQLRHQGLEQADIADRFGIHQVTVSKILLRKLWAHVIIETT